MTIQNIISNNVNLNFNHSNGTISIQLGKAYAQGKLISLDIQYSGTPSLDSLYGLPLTIGTYNGHKVAFTHSEYYHAS